MNKVIKPPFTEQSATEKVQRAEQLWNGRQPAAVALAYTVDSQWRNRGQFLQGRTEIEAFLTEKWQRELRYKLQKKLFCFSADRIAVQFQYEYQDVAGQCYRAHGIEHWQFDEAGLMQQRECSINEVAIESCERRLEY